MKNIRLKHDGHRSLTTIIALFFAAAGLLVIPGCRNPFSPPEDTAASGPGTFLLTIGRQGPARTIAPDLEGAAVRYELAFVPSGNTNTAFSVSDWRIGDTIEISPGIWHLTVNAFFVDAKNPDNFGPHLLFARTLSPLEIDISPQGTTIGKAVLSPITVGNGTFTWHIAVPSDFAGSAASMEAVSIDGGGVPISQSFTAGDSTADNPHYLSLPAGRYRVVFTLDGGDRENAVISEVLHVYANLTSHFHTTLGEMHFPTSLLAIILHEINAGGNIGARFAAREIQAGHFGLLGINGVEDYNGGINISGSFTYLRQPAHDPLTSIDDLSTLTDAALIRVHANGSTHGNRLTAQNNINNMAENGTAVLPLQWASNTQATAVVGPYTVPITFGGEVYDFTVIFNRNDSTGETLPDNFRVYDGQVVLLPGEKVPARTNYVFVGWNTLANGGGRVHAGNSVLTVEGDLDLYAMWMRNDATTPAPPLVTITFLAGGGEGSQSPLTVPQGTEILLPSSSFTRVGHIFVGWDDGAGIRPVGAPFIVSENVILTARWGDPVPFHSVTLRPNGGSGTVVVMTVPYGATVALPDSGFTRQWHELVGWMPGVNAPGVNATPDILLGGSFTVTGDETLHAVWHMPTFTVTFYANGGEGAPPTQDPVLSGTVIPLPGVGGLSKDGHIFTGWNTQPDGLGVHLAGSHFIVTGNTRLYARWVSSVAAPVTVTYRPGPGATGYEHVDYTTDGTIVLLSTDFAGFSKDGHVIIGWRTPGGQLLLGGAPFLVTADIILYAEWLEIKFDDEGAPIPIPTFEVTLINGDEEITLTSVPHGTEITLPGEGFSREGYVMTGWSRDAAASTDHYTPGNKFTVTGNVTLFAVWRQVAVTNMTISPSTSSLVRGGSQEFTVTVFGDHNPPPSVSWGIAGADNGTVHVLGTVVGNTATVTLNVASGQTWGENQIRVTANSLVTAGQSATAYVTVYPPSVVDVVVEGPTSVHRTETPEFTARIDSSTGYAASEDFYWRLTGEVTPGTTISNEPGTRGQITFAATQSPGAITVVAESVYSIASGGLYSGQQTLTVLSPTVTSVTLTPIGTTEIMRGGTANFDLTIAGPGNPGADAVVVWVPVPRGQSGDPQVHSTTTATGNNTSGSVVIAAAPNQALGVIYAQATVTGWPVTPGGDNVGTREVTILPPTGLVVTVDSGPTHSMPRGDHLFAATVTSAAGYASQNVIWDIKSINHAERRPGTMINEHGRLFVPGRQLGTQIVIRATSIYDANAYFEVTITLTGDPAVGRWRMINAGIDHTVALTWDNELYVWGRNEFGQLGLGHTANRNVPTPVLINGVARRDWVSVSAGWAHTVAVRADGTIWGAGQIFHTGHGGANPAVRLGYQDRLAQIGTDSDWRNIFASHSAIFGIREDGSLWSWGSNNSSDGNARGILGHGTAIGSVSTPVRVGDRTDWASVSGSWTHVVAITNEGELFGWGSNSNGQLGRAVTATVSAPLPMTGTGAGMRWHSVAVGNNFTTGIRRDDNNNANNRRLYLWGHNAEGVLGGNTPTAIGGNRTSPGRLATQFGGDYEWASINLNGTSHIVAIRGDDNTLWSWGGTDGFGQLGRGGAAAGHPGGLTGDANATARQTPTQITEGRAGSTPAERPGLGDGADGSWDVIVPFAGKHWVTSVAGGSFSFAIDVAGNLWGWGHNAFGMLGNELPTGSGVTASNRNRPVPIQPGWVPVD